MHNGLIGDSSRLRRKVETLIPDDSMARASAPPIRRRVFFAILGAGGDKDPVGATARTLATLTDMVEPNKEPLRFAAALANGRDLYAFRYSANDNANSLYLRESATMSWWSPSRSTPSARAGSRCARPHDRGAGRQGGFARAVPRRAASCSRVNNSGVRNAVCGLSPRQHGGRAATRSRPAMVRRSTSRVSGTKLPVSAVFRNVLT